MTIGRTSLLEAAVDIAIGAPILALIGALSFQYGMGLHPCEMCVWQRWPHLAAMMLGAMALMRNEKRFWATLSAIALAITAAIGLYHAGVEYGWWQGHTSCTVTLPEGGTPLERIMKMPMTRCDQPQWTVAGISLAGFNFLFSTMSAMLILALTWGGKTKEGCPD